MLLGFNLLLWSGHVTEEHFPILAELKRAGYDGVELPLFEGAPEHYRGIGQALKDNGLRSTGVTVMPDAERDCVSGDHLLGGRLRRSRGRRAFGRTLPSAAWRLFRQSADGGRARQCCERA
jgi:sugar phosphate isomerase/epimerase